MEGPNDWPDIYAAASDCDLLFDKCLRQIAELRTISLLGESAVAFGRLTRDHQARFQAWYSYLGVFAESDVCLDRRLSNSKDIQVMIIEIRDADNPDMVPIGETYTRSVATDFKKTQESIEGAIDRLHRLGVTIRQSSTASLISRVKAFSSKRSDTSLEEISFLMIKFLYPSAPLSLKHLLGRSILERHFNIEYRRRHQRRLASRRIFLSDDDDDDEEKEEEDQPQYEDSGSKLSGPIIKKVNVDNAPNISVKEKDPVASESGTKPSTLREEEFLRRIKEKQPQAAFSANSKTSSVPIGDINYPKPPKPMTDGKSSWAICYWCSESHLYNKFKDPKWWRCHVDRDLRPYVCLINNCSASFDGFDRFSPWMEHMEEHHSPHWISRINCKAMWRCDIEHESPKLFEDEALLKDHMWEHYQAIFTEAQIAGIARRSSIRIPGSEDVCPLCSFDSSKTPLDADEPNHSRYSSQIKRKRDTQTKVNTSVQEKRRKVHFHDEGGRRDLGSTGSSESELDLASGPGIESISPQIKDRLRRKRLSRHIATHLKALSFVSLRLKTFQEQLEIGDQDFATEDGQGDTSEDGGPSGLDTELDAMSLNFDDDSFIPELTKTLPIFDLVSVYTSSRQSSDHRPDLEIDADENDNSEQNIPGPMYFDCFVSRRDIWESRSSFTSDLAYENSSTGAVGCPTESQL